MVAYFNFVDQKHSLSVLNEIIGYPASAGFDLLYKDVFTGVEMVETKERHTEVLPPYGCRVFIVKPVPKGTEISAKPARGKKKK